MARRSAKIAVDVAMGIVLVALMTTALVQEAPHEWLGVALLVLVIVHVVLNRRWMAAVPRMRRDALSVLQLVVLAALGICVVGMAASGLVLSKHVFGFLPVLPGAAWARRVHMICSYWLFVLAFAHAGLHARVPKGKTPEQVWTARVVVAVVACYGIWSIVQLGLWSYLTGQVQFAYVDATVPLALTAIRYADVAMLVAIALHGVRDGLMAARRRRKGSRAL